jgi:hypothetical protein
MKPRIFISHSTKDTKDDAEIVDKIYEVLKKDFDHVFLDRESVIAGDHWRKKILSALGYCDGGVVFFNDKSLESHWVYMESNILRWRSWLDTSFKLVLVCLNDKVMKSLYKGKWKPLSFTEIQVVKCSQPDKIIDELKRILSPLSQCACKETEMEILERVIASDLESLEDRDIQKCLDALDRMEAEYANENPGRSHEAIQKAEELRQCYCSFNSHSYRAKELARKLLQTGLSGFPVFIENAGIFIRERDRKSRILKLIEPLWVNIRSACLLAKTVEKPRAKRMFYLNGNRPEFTGHHYIRRACGLDKGPDHCWPVIFVTGGAEGDNLNQFVVEEIESGLRKKLFRSARVSEADIRRRLEKLNEKRRPVFVVFSCDFFYNNALIQEISSRYPLLTLFFMTGDNSEPTLEDAEPLIPPLKPGEEDKAYDEYLDCCYLIPPDER